MQVSSWICSIGNICEIYSSINYNQMCENMSKKDLSIELEFLRIYFILFNCLSPLLYNLIALDNILKGIGLYKLPHIDIKQENNKYVIKNEFILPNLICEEIKKFFYDPIIHLYIFEWIIIINEKLYKIEKNVNDELIINVLYNDKIYNISLYDLNEIKIWIIKIYSFINCICSVIKMEMKYNWWCSRKEYNPFEINHTEYLYNTDISFILKLVSTINILSSKPNDMRIVFYKINCENNNNNNNIEIEFIYFNKNELNIGDLSSYCLSDSDKSFIVLLLYTILQHPKLYQFLTIHFHHYLVNEEIIFYFSIPLIQKLLKVSNKSKFDNKMEFIVLKDGKRKCSNEKCDKYFDECLKAKTCSKCRRMHYCSKECQIEDWNKKHKILCKEYHSYIKI